MATIPFVKSAGATGESSRLFDEKLQNGFYQTYIRDGVVLDIGYKGDANEPLFTECIGLDTDTPGYDGKRIPYDDGTVGTIICSHVLEHVPDYGSFLREMLIVLKKGGTIILSVPLKDIYERREFPPSAFNSDHLRFYTLHRLFYEIETSVPRHEYKIVFCMERFPERDDFSLPLSCHARGPYEIEVVLEKL